MEIIVPTVDDDPPVKALRSAHAMARAHGVTLSWHHRWPDRVQLYGPPLAVRTVADILTRQGLLRHPAAAIEAEA